MQKQHNAGGLGMLRTTAPAAGQRSALHELSGNAMDLARLDLHDTPVDCKGRMPLCCAASTAGTAAPPAPRAASKHRKRPRFATPTKLCAEYAAQLQRHLRERELLPAHRGATPEAIAARQDPNVLALDERALLVNWMCTRAHAAALRAETLHCAVRLMDRALAAAALPDRLAGEALAAAALRCAAKLEEVADLPPHVAAAGLHAAVTPAAVAAAENALCAALGYALHAPSVVSFLPRYLKAAGCTQPRSYEPVTQQQQHCRQQQHAAPWAARAAHLAAYLAELSLGSLDAMRMRPSALAAAAVSTALRGAGAADAWTPTLAHATGYTAPAAFAAEAALLAALHAGAEDAPLKATFRRGCGAELMRVASQAFYAFRLLPLATLPGGDKWQRKMRS
ncbi:hypothetical protein JKP88DRAFT_317076 [Tribonema minus]|uniref:Cyclin C-terminal domain-containing protein n=1 Tax=Tribonema minus TaxID=303371 RepID=A0A835Z6V4_9STRA|nr:hypothetical protein JKP88DRAFT_317076 [Tribonema minus]